MIPPGMLCVGDQGVSAQVQIGALNRLAVAFDHDECEIVELVCVTNMLLDRPENRLDHRHRRLIFMLLDRFLETMVFEHFLALVRRIGNTIGKDHDGIAGLHRDIRLGKRVTVQHTDGNSRCFQPTYLAVSRYTDRLLVARIAVNKFVSIQIEFAVKKRDKPFVTRAPVHVRVRMGHQLVNV